MTTSNLSFLGELQAVIQERQREPVPGSYTNQLLDAGTKRIAQKVGEEAVEVALAAVAGDRSEAIDEAADLLYHLLVLLNSQQITLDDVVAALEARHTS